MAQEDFESLARRYWGAWGDAMRAAMPDAAGGAVPGFAGAVPGFAGAMPSFAGAMPGAATSGAQAWHDAIDWWTKYAYGNRTEVNDVLSRFNAQARQWYGQMQQVAARFAGQDAKPADIAQAWKQALGAAGENPFPEMLRSMRGHGMQGMEQWIEDASPWLEAMRSEGASWLRLPAFGFAREHQERLQRLAQAQLDVQQQTSAYNALMLKASQAAYEIFESKLAEREEPGRQIDSPRALFDLWIDAAEEAYAQIALSHEFREVYARLANAQMRLRAGVQREVEEMTAQLGMPTRSELDGAHRKIAELERVVRRMRDAAPKAASPQKPAAPAQAAVREPAAKKTAPAASSKRTRAASPQKKRAARKAAPAPAVRRAPTNGFSSIIPIAIPATPEPMPPAKTPTPDKRKPVAKKVKGKR
jgi:class III poly(R)-hydroxyalkanoic acid synthase PhaE subunit